MEQENNNIVRVENVEPTGSTMTTTTATTTTTITTTPTPTSPGEDKPQDQISNWLPITASRKAKWWYSAFHNVTAMVGAGVLGLPFALSQLGWFVYSTLNFVDLFICFKLVHLYKIIILLLNLFKYFKSYFLFKILKTFCTSKIILKCFL